MSRNKIECQSVFRETIGLHLGDLSALLKEMEKNEI